MLDPVRARQARRGDRGAQDAEASRVGAHVGEQLGAHREDRPVATGGQLDVVPLLARVSRRGHVLAPGLDPLHGRAQAHRQQGDQDLLGVDLLLHAEAAAHVGSDHADPVLGEPEHVSQDVADSMRPLRGGPHREPPGTEIVVGSHAASLQRHPGVPLNVVPLSRHHLGGSEDRIGVADPHGEVRRDVSRDLVVEQRGAGGDGRLSVGHRIVRLVLDGQRGRAVLGHIAARGDDGGHRLADEAHLADRQRGLAARAQRRVGDDRGNVAKAAGRREVGRREDAHDAVEIRRRRGVDVEARVRVHAARDGHVTDTREAQVVEERRLPAQEARVLEARQGLTGELGSHVGRRGSQLYNPAA